MGTTQDAIRGSNHGPELGYVLVIEGYKYLITDGNPSDVVTAWAATDWADALPGLQVDGTFSQSLTPWGNEVEVPEFKFSVQPEVTDQFGRDMFTSKPSVRSELTVGFDSGDSFGGSFDITVQDAGLFTGTHVNIGNETFAVTGTPAGTTIAIALDGAGVFHPFSSNAGATNTFPGPHQLSLGELVDTTEAKSPVYVTSAPATWIGKKVALYVHKVTAGVWDVQAQAEIWFAGTIARVSEVDLMTVVECTGIQQALIDAVLMQDQWSGKIKGGYTFTDGEAVTIGFYRASGTDVTEFIEFVSGTDFTTAKYTAAEFGSVLAALLDADATVGAAGSAITLRWSSSILSSDNGARWQLTAQESTSMDASINLTTTSKPLLQFLGFPSPTPWSDGRFFVGVGVQSGADITLSSEDPPLLNPSARQSNGTFTLEIENTDGKFVDHTSALPPDAREHVTGAEVWSYYMMNGDTLFLGRRDSNTQISGITVRTGISSASNRDFTRALVATGGDSEGIVKQVYVSSESFCATMAKLFASIDGNGSNHATYDVLPFGAGIPWSLLGQPFLDSMADLEQAGVENSIVLMIEKPTRLWDAVKADFALRMAHPMWKEGGLIVAQLSVPNASASTFTLTEENKMDSERTLADTTSEFLTHTLKIEFNRSLVTDKFQNTHIARDPVAYQNAGQGGGTNATKTISARNSYASGIGAGASIRALADMLTSRFLNVFAKPLKRWRRSIPQTMFHMAPGDTVTFTDDYVRRPEDGVRGVTNRAATVVGTSHSFGFSSGGQEMFGEVTLLYTEEDRLFPLAPSCEHAFAITSGAYTAGYDAAGKKLLVHQHRFSKATGSNDSASYDVGDEVRLTALDPADPTAASTHTDVIAAITVDDINVSSVDYDALTLTTGFAPTAGITYLVNFDAYNVVGSDQQLVAFQADEDDGQILDTIDPNLVGDIIKPSFAAADPTELPARHSNEQFGDGEPVSASFMRDQLRMANVISHYKTAGHSPAMAQSNAIVGGLDPGEFIVLWTFPFLIGTERWMGGRRRSLNVAPMFLSGDGSSVNVRVTSSANPPKGDTYTNTVWSGPLNQVDFTTTSTTLTIVAAQELGIVRGEQNWVGNGPDITWITVEGSDLVGFRGLGELWLGPLQ